MTNETPAIARRDYVSDAITSGAEMSLPLLNAINATAADPADQRWLMELLIDEFDGPEGAERWLLDFSARAHAYAEQEQREAEEFAASADRVATVMEERGAKTIGDLFAN